MAPPRTTRIVTIRIPGWRWRRWIAYRINGAGAVVGKPVVHRHRETAMTRAGGTRVRD